jgi:HK97 family phage major capsid protein
MAFNSEITRSNAQALVPEEVSNAMLKKLNETSAALSTFTTVPVSRNQVRFPVLEALPIAGFVNGDTGLKQTTSTSWKNKFLNIEEIAVIVPVPEAVLDDVEFDIWEQIQPLMETAIARTLDAAVFFGVNKPESWPEAIAAQAITASNTVTRGANAAEKGGIVGDFSDAFAKVEEDGYDVDWVVATRAYKGKLRQARATTGESLIGTGSGQVSGTEVLGVDVAYPMKGLWPTGGSHPVEAIAGDPSEQVLAVRQDITIKMLDEAVIQDGEGNIAFNLAQQDMVAMRVVFRAGWQTANTINYQNENESTRYPAAVVLAT